MAKTATTTVKFKRQFDPTYKGQPTQNESGEKLTVPDMSKSIRELLQFHARGLNTAVYTNEGIYTGIEVPRFNDITEVVAYKQALRTRQAELDEQIKQESLKPVGQQKPVAQIVEDFAHEQAEIVKAKETTPE